MVSLSAAMRTREGRLRGWAAALVLVALLPMMTGCFGRFPLTRSVYEFNKDISNDELVQSVTMWVLAILPVYGIATLGDVAVIHLIEFWSGEPVNVRATTLDDGSEMALEPSADGRQMTLTVRRDGEVTSRAVFVQTADGRFEVRDADGRLAGAIVRTPAGALRLTDAQGATVRVLPAERVAALSDS